MANCIRCGRQLPPLSFKKICQWCVQHEAAQRGDADDARQQVMPTPWVRRSESAITLTRVLFGANVAVFLAMAFSSSSIESFPGQTLVQFGGNYGPLTLSGDWWRLVTYMFLHGGIMHIAFNMWCLWDLGALCESLYGRATFAAIYFLTGIAAGITSTGWNPAGLSVGASGAIFGLAGALIASFYLGEFSLPSVAIKATLRSLLFFAAFNIFFGFVVPGVDNSAHVGGLISGLILGALIARFAPSSASRRAVILVIMTVAVAASGLAVQRWRGAPFRIARAVDFLSDEPDRAIAQLQSEVKQRPNSADAHYALGSAYFSKRQSAQAEAEFKKALELDPQHPHVRFELGIVYLTEGRASDAEAEFQQALNRDANDVYANYGMGLALADEGKYQAAIEKYKTAIRFGVPFPGANYKLGESYAALKMYDDAIPAYLKEKEKNGDDPDLENALADAYQAKGMTQQAQDARNKASQLRTASHN